MKRLPAEWEPQAFLQFAFPHERSDWAYKINEVTECFVEMISKTSKFEDILVICDNVNRIKSFFQSKERIYFAALPANDTWIRDYGGITVIEDNRPIIYDFIFNGWGQKYNAELDNQVTLNLWKKNLFLNSSLLCKEMVLEGGSIDSDGNGTILTTSKCLLNTKRNPELTKEQIEKKLIELFGVRQILWIDHGYLAGDDTDSHIDTLARFCNEKTIVYTGCNNSEDQHYDELQRMKEQLLQFKNINGNPYQLIELPLPDPCFNAEGNRLPATYANFAIINGAVLVPVYAVQQDKDAINIFKTCFPKREIIDINCRILIEQNGSLHCSTMHYPKPVILNKEILL